jgi:hypothetical protein
MNKKRERRKTIQEMRYTQIFLNTKTKKEQNLSREANSLSYRQEMPPLILNPMFNYHGVLCSGNDAVYSVKSEQAFRRKVHCFITTSMKT